MLNYLWAGMILAGVLYAAVTGNIEAVSGAALESAGEAISLCVTMAGVVSLWMGLMEIGQSAGLIRRLTDAIGPFLNYMFPRIPREHPARQYIATNLIANVLGLGWACTPAGLKAMEELANLERERGNPEYAVPTSGNAMQPDAPEDAAKASRSASDEMCIFLILNISSLQLIPVNMIAYRSSYDSADPACIILPAIVATMVSAAVSIVYCKWKSGRRL